MYYGSEQLFLQDDVEYYPSYPFKALVEAGGEDSKSLVIDDIKSLVLNFLEGQTEGGVRLPKALQEDVDFLDAITYNALLRSEVSRDNGKRFSLVSRAWNVAARVQLIDGVLLEIFSALKRNLGSALRRIEQVGAVCGLASLPSEALNLIFSFAIYGTPKSTEPRSLATVRLSHVCRHFRKIITTNPSFWTEISTTPRKPNLGLVQIGLQRSSDFPLDIHLNLYIHKVVLDYIPVDPAFDTRGLYPNGYPVYGSVLLRDPILDVLIPHTNRWRGLHLHYYNSDGYNGNPEAFEYLEGVSLPTLEVVTEDYTMENWDPTSQYTFTFDRTMKYASSWSIPNLRSLVLRKSFPDSLPSLTSITAFDVGLSFHDNIVKLFRLILRMPSLSVLSVEIPAIEYHLQTPSGPSADLVELEKCEDVVLDGVREFTIRCYSDDVADDKPRALQFLRLVLAKLYFRNATKFVFKGLRRTRYGRDKKAECMIPFHELLSGIPERFPSVVNCSIFISKDNNRLDATTLPIHLPHKIENLTFVCNTRVVFPDEDVCQTDPVVGKLRTITLGLNPAVDFQGFGGVTRWVLWLVDSVKGRGGWRKFHKLTVRRLVGKGREPEDEYVCEKTVMRDKIVSWTKSRFLFSGTEDEYRRQIELMDNY